jgi:hypothetical protein
MACIRSSMSVADRERTVRRLLQLRPSDVRSVQLHGEYAGMANATDAEEDWILSDSHWRLHGRGCSDGGGDDDDDAMIMDARCPRQAARQVAQSAVGATGGAALAGM